MVKEGRGMGVGVQECFTVTMRKSAYNCGWRGKMNTREGQLVREEAAEGSGPDCTRPSATVKGIWCFSSLQQGLLFLMILASSK